MDAPAQGVAIVPLQRIASRQTMIARQRQRILDHGDRVVGHRQLDDMGLDDAERQVVVEIIGKTADQARIHRKPRLDAAEHFLGPWQGRQRRAEVGRNTVFEEADQPVAGCASDAVIDRSDEDGVYRRLGEIGRPPFFRRANVDLMVERKHHVFEDDVMAAAGTQAEMIPGLDDPGTRKTRRHQEHPDARFGFIGPGPDGIPFQDRRSGRIDLAARQPPSGFGAAGDRRGQSSARR